MDLGLRDRVAIVTGAARGIGLEHARTLGAEGATLMLNDLDPVALDEAAEQLARTGVTVATLPGDASDEAVVRDAIASVTRRFGRIDILVNNAGIGVKPPAPVAELPLDAWRQMIQVHLDSTFLWSREVVPAMRSGAYGRIVNTSSMNFAGGGRPGVAHYSAAKAGIVGLTRTMAREVGRDGITVNAIAPGYVATDLISQFPDDMMDRLKRQNPVGRLCRPEEVASLVAWLCSVHAGFVSGECICMDGARRDFFWG